MLARGEELGPRDDDGGDAVELERGARDQRGEIGYRTGEDVYGAVLQDASATGETGDGVDTDRSRSARRPLGRGSVVPADNHGGCGYQLPDRSRLLYVRRQD